MRKTIPLTILLFLLLLGTGVQSQKLRKADKQILAGLQQHIGFLADDKLEGRRTGTGGEKLAYEYIIAVFEKTGLLPKGDHNSYLQEFEVKDGRQVNPSTYLFINGAELKQGKDFFPLAWSANGSAEAMSSPALPEKGIPWFLDLKELIDKNKDNPHFDLESSLQDEVKESAKRGAAAIIVYNTSDKKEELGFNAKDNSEPAKIPVVYITKESITQYVNQPERNLRSETENRDRRKEKIRSQYCWLY
jgi:hypothetical protein